MSSRSIYFTWTIFVILFLTAFFTLTSKINLNPSFPFKGAEASESQPKSTLELWNKFLNNFNENELEEILTQFNQIISHLDVASHSIVGQFLAVLNAEPEWDNVLLHLSQEGFPNLIGKLKIDLLSSLLEFLASIPSSMDPSDPELLNQEIRKMNEVSRKHLDVPTILTYFLNQIQEEKLLQDLIEFFQDPKRQSALINFSKEPSTRFILSFIFYSFGVLESDMTFSEEIIPLIDKLNEVGLNLRLPENKEPTRLAWMYNPDTEATYLMDVDSQKPRPDVALMQTLKFYRQLKSNGYDHVIEIASAYFPHLDEIQMHDELSQVRKALQMLPNRPVPLPGNNPPRPLEEIQSQVQVLNENKILFDKMKQIVQSEAGNSFGPNFSKNLIVPFKTFLYEAEALQMEISLNEYENIELLDQLISDLLALDGVTETDPNLTSLELALTELINIDLEGFLQLWPKFASILGKLRDHLTEVNDPTMHLLMALINAEVAVDNVLIYLAHNGYPTLKEMNKMEILINFLESLPPPSKEDSYFNQESTQEPSLEQHVGWMREAFFYLIDSNNFMQKFFQFQGSNLAFHNFVRVLSGPDVRGAYRRIMDNLIDSNNNSLDNSIRFLLGLENVLNLFQDTPSEFNLFLQSTETLFNWGQSVEDKPLKCWHFDPNSNDLILKLVSESDQSQVYRSLFLKLERDLRSTLETDQEEEQPDDSNSHQFLNQLTLMANGTFKKSVNTPESSETVKREPKSEL